MILPLRTTRRSSKIYSQREDKESGIPDLLLGG